MASYSCNGLRILFSVLLVSVVSHLNVRAQLTCPAYPVGLTGSLGDISYSAIDVNGNSVIIGGNCADSAICTSHTGKYPNPIVQMLNSLTL